MKKPTRDKKEYIEAVVYVPEALADAVGNYVTDNITSGIVFDDSEKANLIGIKFYVPLSMKKDFRPALAEYLFQISQIASSHVPKIHEQMIQSKDWEETYKNSVKPIVIGKEIGVRPPWAKIPHGVIFDIVIEPRMAFGTGQHETTRACLQLIKKHFHKSWRFLDFGCGSGVLSILADKIGAIYVKAVDYDMTAVENCRENFEINKLKCDNDVRFGSIETAVSDAPFEMVCANLNKVDIIDNFGQLLKLISDGGYLILSGLLEIDKNEIESCINHCRLTVKDFIHENEWLTYCLQK